VGGAGPLEGFRAAPREVDGAGSPVGGEFRAAPQLPNAPAVRELAPVSPITYSSNPERFPVAAWTPVRRVHETEDGKPWRFGGAGALGRKDSVPPRK
jgi:hypothetical protein